MGNPATFNAAQAWRDAVALIRSSASLQVVLAGLFIFIPQALLLVLAPDLVTEPVQAQMRIAPGDDAMPEAPPVRELLLTIGLGVFQMFGLLAMTAVMDKRRRPTVADALTAARRAILPLIGTALIVIAAALVISVPLILLAWAAGPIGSNLLSIAVIIAVLVLFIRLSVLTPLLAIERLIASFYMLLLVAALVIAIPFSLGIGGLLLLSDGQDVFFGLIVLVRAGSSAIINVVFAAVAVAVYDQLAGTSAPDVSETFR